MPIDYNELRGLTVRRIMTALTRDDFYLVRQKGATRFFKHDDGRSVTLHVHRQSQTLPLGTLREIIENEARWTTDDLHRLRLIR